jgi:hypothetical protein
VAPADTPLWRRAFDDVERRVGQPLASATSSSDFQSAVVKVRRLRRTAVRPVHAVAGLALHLVGLPSNAEVRHLRRELHEVQREVSSLRRDRALVERDGQDPS